jgi:hypothetical protein
MKFFILTFLFLTHSAWSGVGKVVKTSSTDNAVIQRASRIIKIIPGTNLEVGDVIQSQNSLVLLHIYPGIQVSLDRNSEIKISEGIILKKDDLEKINSVIDLIKGSGRFKVSKDFDQGINQRVQSSRISFDVSEAEFEVSLGNNQIIDLHVFDGEVQANSPDVHTFVPEIIKAKEGFRFETTKKAFSRIRFAPKFLNHLALSPNNEIKKKWRSMRKDKKTQTLPSKIKSI